MTDKEAQEKAEKVQELSISIYKVAHTLSHMEYGMNLLSEELFRSSLLLSDIVKGLPPKVQEKLKSIVPEQHEGVEIKNDDDDESLANWIRKVIRGGK